MNYLRRVVLPLLIAIFAACALVAPPAAQAHIGDHPHVPDAWYAGYDYITFDKAGPPWTVGDGWLFGQMVDTIDARTAGAHMPVLRMGECENTQGPCVNVFEMCDGPDWVIKWDRNNFGPVEGQGLLNRCGDPNGRDRSASCRLVMRILGVHEHTGAGCTSSPWSFAADYPTDAVYDVVNGAYQNSNGRQLPDPNG